MSTRNRTPPLLEPYLRLPTPGSQLLLTGVLDSSPHWLVTRLLRSAFTPSSEPQSSLEEEQDVTVVLVSWLRDFEFWKAEARRGAICFCGWVDAFVSFRDCDGSIDDNSSDNTKNPSYENHSSIAIAESKRPTTISRSRTFSRSTTPCYSITTTSTNTTTTTTPSNPTPKTNLPQRLLNPLNPSHTNLPPNHPHFLPPNQKNPSNPRRTNPPPLNFLFPLRLRLILSPPLPALSRLHNNTSPRSRFALPIRRTPRPWPKIHSAGGCSCGICGATGSSQYVGVEFKTAGYWES
ncbi:hypothetical protein KCU65_g8275, partial [Aureobasidium melanogenum]